MTDDLLNRTHAILKKRKWICASDLSVELWKSRSATSERKTNEVLKMLEAQGRAQSKSTATYTAWTAI